MTRPCPGCGADEPRRFATKDGYTLVRCGRCATLYTTEPAGADYNDYYEEEDPGAPAFVAKRCDEIVGAFAPFRQDGRLLDVGFGAADILQAARRAKWNVCGVEVSSSAIDHARQCGFDVFHGLLHDRRYESASFDVVVVSELLEHVAEVQPLLEEIARVLRPGGLLWATTPHAHGLSERILGAKWSVVSPPVHVQLFSIRGLRQLLEATGFEDVSISAQGFNPREVWQSWRGNEVGIKQRIELAYGLNAFFEEDPLRRAVKRSLNGMLSALRLGDSLKVFARRRRSL